MTHPADKLLADIVTEAEGLRLDTDGIFLSNTHSLGALLWLKKLTPDTFRQIAARVEGLKAELYDAQLAISEINREGIAFSDRAEIAEREQRRIAAIAQLDEKRRVIAEREVEKLTKQLTDQRDINDCHCTNVECLTQERDTAESERDAALAECVRLKDAGISLTIALENMVSAFQPSGRGPTLGDTVNMMFMRKERQDAIWQEARNTLARAALAPKEPT